MSYLALIAPCFACRRVFASNPDLVPSYENQPICEACITQVNANRAASGLPQWPVLPGAYEAEEV